MSRRRWSPFAVSVLAVLACLASAEPSAASLSVVPPGSPQGFGVTTSTSQAGAPTDFVANFTLTRDSPTPWPGQDVVAGDTGGILRDVIVDLPAGMNGNGRAVPQCPELIDVSLCPVESQIGLIDVKAVTIVEPDFILHNRLVLPLYNLTPSFGEVVRVGAASAQISVQMIVTLRPGGDGVRVEAHRMSSALPVVSGTLTIWGLPGHPSHDPQRCRQLTPLAMSDDFETVPFCNAASGQPVEQPQSFEGEVNPFLTNATTCGSAQKTGITVSGWDAPGHFETETAAMPSIVGCDQLGFAPQLEIRTDSAAADTPTGLEVQVDVPQTEGQ